MAAVLERYRALVPELDDTDGISTYFGEWRYNLRCSNTEPLVRLNVEARGNPRLVEDRVGEIADVLRGFVG